MPETPRERVAKYNLTSATEDTYSSQVAENPNSARRVLSFIPSPAGYLEREAPNARVGANTLPGPVIWLFEYDQNNSGTILRYYFAATASFLYMLTDPMNGIWTQQTQIGALTPNAQLQGEVLQNLMHFSDGVSHFTFDGTNWTVDGLPIPQHAPIFNVQGIVGGAVSIASIKRVNGVVTLTTSTALTLGGEGFVTVTGVGDTSYNGEFQVSQVSSTQFTYMQTGFPDSTSSGGTVQASQFTVQTNRYYWTTWADISPTHPHESSSSPRSLGTGPFTNEAPIIFMRPGTLSVASGSSAVTGNGTDWDADDLGMTLHYGSGGSATILSVQDSQHLTLTAPATTAASNSNLTIAPARATVWNIYCSETENSNVGFFLASVSITSFNYIDQSPFSNDPNSYIDIALQRPIRNDPPTGTRVMAVHKRRLFRRLESLQNFFNYTAAEEVQATNVGTPQECVPGADPNTISDLVNEQSYPDQSHHIIAMVSHADALFIGSEKNTIPLFGETIDDFSLSQINAFSVGMGSVYAAISTPHGLGFLSYDRKVYLWPQQWIPFYAPEETTTLIELSKPLRLKFQAINPSNMGGTWFAFFNYGQRDWMATCFQLNDQTWHTYIFDFETKGWFEMQRGVSSLAVFEPQSGVKVLVGGGTDGIIYVLNDPSVQYDISTDTYPLALFRPSLIDFGQPDTKHVLLYCELELSNSAMMNDITVNFYLDPVDADNPGPPTPLTMSPVFGANRFRGFFQGGSLCERVLMEVNLAASQNNGVIRSFTLTAKSASKLAGN